MPPLTTGFAPRRAGLKDSEPQMRSAEAAILAAAAATGARSRPDRRPRREDDRPYKRPKVKPQQGRACSAACASMSAWPSPARCCSPRASASTGCSAWAAADVDGAGAHRRCDAGQAGPGAGRRRHGGTRKVRGLRRDRRRCRSRQRRDAGLDATRLLAPASPTWPAS